MRFTSWAFLAFLAVLLPIYYLAPKRGQWIVLLLANAVFYAFAGLLGVVFMLVTIASAYGVSRILDASLVRQAETLSAMKAQGQDKDARKAVRQKMERGRRLWLVACLVLNFGILFAMKYGAAAMGLFTQLFALPNGTAELALTMGASFYTFSTMGYLLDVHRGTLRAERNPFRLALFTSFFPLLVQGPICRFQTLGETLFAPHRFSGEAFYRGLVRILWGYWKKLLIAERLIGAVRTIAGDPEAYRGAYVFLGMLLYAACLYADFTGGIDITIGVGELFGVRIEENFLRPYFSNSIAEYWRRWHITLGLWFKEYVYYPLSVSTPLRRLTQACRRLGDGFARRVPVYLATLVVWTITGMWHGNSWNFVVWGLLNGVVILLSEELSPLYRRFHTAFPRLKGSVGYRLFSVLRTILLLSSLRILDCYATVGASFRAFGSLFSTWNWRSLPVGMQTLGLSWADYGVVLLGVALMTIVSLLNRKESIRDRLQQRALWVRLTVVCVLGCTILVFGRYGFGFDVGQFIYNRY